jgi:diguanylate cyclase
MPLPSSPGMRRSRPVWSRTCSLLSNAIKFTPSGGVVRMTARREGQSVIMDVRDTGIGIAPDLLPSIFEPFHQGDASTTRAHSGIGLGLSIARHLVQLHGGTIVASSGGLNQGAVFTVRLPSEPPGAERAHGTVGSDGDLVHPPLRGGVERNAE